MMVVSCMGTPVLGEVTHSVCVCVCIHMYIHYNSCIRDLHTLAWMNRLCPGRTDELNRHSARRIQAADRALECSDQFGAPVKSMVQHAQCFGYM